MLFCHLRDPLAARHAEEPHHVRWDAGVNVKVRTLQTGVMSVTTKEIVVLMLDCCLRLVPPLEAAAARGWCLLAQEHGASPKEPHCGPDLCPRGH